MNFHTIGLWVIAISYLLVAVCIVHHYAVYLPRVKEARHRRALRDEINAHFAAVEKRERREAAQKARAHLN